MSRHGFAVWSTQGGGLVRKEGESYVFVEVPEGFGLQVGDRLPGQWDLVPANEHASEDDFPTDDLGI